MKLSEIKNLILICDNRLSDVIELMNQDDYEKFLDESNEEWKSDFDGNEYKYEYEYDFDCPTLREAFGRGYSIRSLLELYLIQQTRK